MLETVFYKMVDIIVSKQKEAEKWHGTICPKITKKLHKFLEWSKNCMVIGQEDESTKCHQQEESLPSGLSICIIQKSAYIHDVIV
jgi:hypothetical protein